MKISNHKLEGMPFKAAHSYGGAMTPTLIVLHDTAGRLDKGSSVNWFCSKDCPTSAHVVVERDGSITQMVPFNRKAFHAGRSVWKGREYCNGFSIGIEIVNPGELDANGKAWFGEVFSGSVRRTTKEHGTANWIDYTPEQIEAVTDVCNVLVEKYAIEDITAHFVISPKRKVDVGPLFPLEQVREAAFGRAVEVAVAPDVSATPSTKTVAVHKASRKMKAAGAGEKMAIVGGLGGLGITVSDAFGYAQQAAQFVKTYGLEISLVMFFTASVAFAAIKHFTKDDHASGRYVPSGGAE